MNLFARLFFGLLLVAEIGAQEYSPLDTMSEEPEREFSIKAFSYPTFLNGETHSEFTVRYPFSEKLEGELQGFYDTYILADVTRFAFRGKYYTGENLYFFSGMAVEFERNKASGVPTPPRFLISNGTGYNFNDRLNLELKHELLINKKATGNYGLPNLFSVHGKYKF